MSKDHKKVLTWKDDRNQLRTCLLDHVFVIRWSHTHTLTGTRKGLNMCQIETGLIRIVTILVTTSSIHSRKLPKKRLENWADQCYQLVLSIFSNFITHQFYRKLSNIDKNNNNNQEEYAYMVHRLNVSRSDLFAFLTLER